MSLEGLPEPESIEKEEADELRDRLRLERERGEERLTVVVAQFNTLLDEINDHWEELMSTDANDTEEQVNQMEAEVLRILNRNTNLLQLANSYSVRANVLARERLETTRAELEDQRKRREDERDTDRQRFLEDTEEMRLRNERILRRIGAARRNRTEQDEETVDNAQPAEETESSEEGSIAEGDVEEARMRVEEANAELAELRATFQQMDEEEEQARVNRDIEVANADGEQAEQTIYITAEQMEMLNLVNINAIMQRTGAAIVAMNMGEPQVHVSGTSVEQVNFAVELVYEVIHTHNLEEEEQYLEVERRRIQEAIDQSIEDLENEMPEPDFGTIRDEQQREALDREDAESGNRERSRSRARGSQEEEPTQEWSMSRIDRNREMHASNGNGSTEPTDNDAPEVKTEEDPCIVQLQTQLQMQQTQHIEQMKNMMDMFQNMMQTTMISTQQQQQELIQRLNENQTKTQEEARTHDHQILNKINEQNEKMAEACIAQQESISRALKRQDKDDDQLQIDEMKGSAALKMTKLDFRGCSNAVDRICKIELWLKGTKDKVMKLFPKTGEMHWKDEVEDARRQHKKRIRLAPPEQACAKPPTMPQANLVIERTVAPIMLEALDDRVQEIITNDEVETCIAGIVWAALWFAYKGTANDRKEIFDYLQRPGERGELTIAKNTSVWGRMCKVAKDWDIDPPDTTILLQGLDEMTKPAIRTLDEDTKLQIQMARVANKVLTLRGETGRDALIAHAGILTKIFESFCPDYLTKRTKGGPGPPTGTAAAHLSHTGGGNKTGKVKAWNKEKGYGFVQAEDGTADLFVHASALTDGGELHVGNTVKFTVVDDKKKGGKKVGSLTGATGRKREATTRTETRTCRRCGKPGHIEKDCRQPAAKGYTATSGKEEIREVVTDMLREGEEQEQPEDEGENPHEQENDEPKKSPKKGAVAIHGDPAHKQAFSGNVQEKLSILDTGASEVFKHRANQETIKTKDTVEGFNNQIHEIDVNDRQEYITDGQQLMPVGKSAIYANQTFAWIQGTNQPHFAELSDKDRNTIKAVLQKYETMPCHNDVPFLPEKKAQNIRDKIAQARGYKASTSAKREHKPTCRVIEATDIAEEHARKLAEYNIRQTPEEYVMIQKGGAHLDQPTGRFVTNDDGNIREPRKSLHKQTMKEHCTGVIHRAAGHDEVFFNLKVTDSPQIDMHDGDWAVMRYTPRPKDSHEETEQVFRARLC